MSAYTKMKHNKKSLERIQEYSCANWSYHLQFGMPSLFHNYCLSIGISQEHLKKWLVGSFRNNTFFVYSKNVSGRSINVAVGSFDAGGYPTNVKPLRRLKNNTKGRYYGICMYGEHLLSKDPKRPVIIVNGEHIAVICSWFFPHFDWLATGKLDKNGPEIITLL